LIAKEFTQRKSSNLKKKKIMNFVTSLFIALIFVANLVFAQPSLADKPKFLKNPDYIEVTKAINELKAAQQVQAQTETSNPEEVQKKIDELEFQKYALETGINWGQCRNETGKTIAVYGPKPDFDDDDYKYAYANGLYFLADGQTTKKKWDCEGVYLPSGATTTVSSNGQNQEVSGPVAVKIGDGTQLVIKTNQDTGAIEFSIPPTKLLKSGEANWFIPNVSQSVIDTRVANAPVAKNKNKLVVLRNPEKELVESNTAPKTTAPKTQPQSPPQSEDQSQPQSQSSSLKPSYLNRR
jgi:hypothetical protein